MRLPRLRTSTRLARLGLLFACVSVMAFAACTEEARSNASETDAGSNKDDTASAPGKLANPEPGVCLVSGVPLPEEPVYVEHDGNTYAVRCVYSRRAFLQNPEGFIAGTAYMHDATGRVVFPHDHGDGNLEHTHDMHNNPHHDPDYEPHTHDHGHDDGQHHHGDGHGHHHHAPGNSGGDENK